MKCVGIIDGVTKVLNIEDDLEVYYDLLKCRMIDITTRKIGGKYYDIICDDEGLLKEEIRISAMDKDNEPCLAGSIIICNFDDDDGREQSLDDADIRNIFRNIITFVNMVDGEETDVLIGVDY